MAFKTMTNRTAGYRVAESDWDDITDNFSALNTAFRIDLEVETSLAPASGITAAAVSLTESTAAGTDKPVINCISFDDTTKEGRMWNVRVPRLYGGTPTLKGSYKMAGANTGKSVRFGCQVAAVSDGDSHDDVAFAAQNAIDESVPNAAGESDEFEITIASDDGMAAGDWLCVLLYRNPAADDAIGDCMVTSLALHYTLEV